MTTAQRTATWLQTVRRWGLPKRAVNVSPCQFAVLGCGKSAALTSMRSVHEPESVWANVGTTKTLTATVGEGNAVGGVGGGVHGTCKTKVGVVGGVKPVG